MQRPSPLRRVPVAALTLGLAALGLAAASGAGAQPLAFQVHEGRNLNAFERDGPVAAHLILRDGASPRLIVAFPAGDSGVGAWFNAADKPVRWRIDGPLRPVLLHDAHGRPLHGVSADVAIDTPRLALGRVVVGSVRVLRDYEALHTAPAKLDAPARRQGATVTWARDRIDGAPGYLLSVEALDGATASGDGSWSAQGRGPIRLRIIAATGETPLEPRGLADILTSEAGRDPRARESLAFLSYREKLLAGSWRFDTYFGRDTLMTVRLLLPVLKPAEAETGLASVLERLSPDGQVAHEEAIGEFAILENIKAGRGPIDTPVYDYKMIDGNYMLAPVLRAYAESFGAERLKAFLARRAPGGSRYGDLLVRNLRLVMAKTAPFAAEPGAERLLHLKPGVPVGQWRDSETGLAGGRIPYDVNAVFAPAALSAIAQLDGSGALSPYLSAGGDFKGAAAQAQVWRRAAPRLFLDHLSASEARADVARFARESGVGVEAPLASLPADGLTFEALSLDAEGRPIGVLNTDVGFDLLFGEPDPATAVRMIDNLMRPFPAGAMTDVGALAADAAYAPANIRAEFSKTAYSAAVVWAWQEAVLIAGLDRQLRRTDLPPDARASLASARDRLWRAVEAVGETRTSELWSWAYANGHYTVQPFGAAAADADESNAAQLWSTVFLALKARPGAAP